MRTLTSGKGKVHHLPAHNPRGIGFQIGFTIYACGRDSLNAVEHESTAPTCKVCQGKLRTAEFEAYWEAQRRQQRADEAAAYERIAQREAEEKAIREAARVTPAVHVVDLKSLPSYGEDHWDSQTSDEQARVVYRMHSRYGRGVLRFGVFYVGPNGEARRTHGGPILSGPYCALIPLATVISAWAGPREESVEVKEGDVLLLNGVPMILIDDQRYDYPHAVTPAEYGARLAAREVRKLRDAKISTTDRAPWDAALQEAELAVTSLYRNGHGALPFAFDSPAAEVVPEPEAEQPVEYRDSYVSYAGHAYRVLGSEGDALRYGLWVQHAEAEDEPVLFIRMGPDGLGDPIAQCLTAWGMASTITAEVIQWDNEAGHYLDRAGNVRADIQLR